jgi:hypothetical protein
VTHLRQMMLDEHPPVPGYLFRRPWRWHISARRKPIAYSIIIMVRCIRFPAESVAAGSATRVNATAALRCDWGMRYYRHNRCNSEALCQCVRRVPGGWSANQNLYTWTKSRLLGDVLPPGLILDHGNRTKQKSWTSDPEASHPAGRRREEDTTGLCCSATARHADRRPHP